MKRWVARSAAWIGVWGAVLIAFGCNQAGPQDRDRAIRVGIYDSAAVEKAFPIAEAQLFTFYPEGFTGRGLPLGERRRRDTEAAQAAVRSCLTKVLPTVAREMQVDLVVSRESHVPSTAHLVDVTGIVIAQLREALAKDFPLMRFPSLRSGPS